MTARPSSDLVDSSAVARFLASVGLTTPVDDATARRLADRFEALVVATPEIPADDERLLALFRYSVPKLGPGGSCSISHELEPEPFDLRGDALRGLSLSELRRHPETARLARLAAIVRFLHEETGSDWTGIYRRVRLSDGGEALRKEAYLGLPSRALFPLTEEFARTSNNSTAALSGRAIVVDDVEAHIAAGRPYYECDAEVRSELCVPVVAEDGRVVGLLDLESFAPRRYGPAAVAAVAAASIALLQGGLLVPGGGE